MKRIISLAVFIALCAILWMYDALLTFVIIGLVVSVHEYGHYKAMQWTGIICTDFSIGIGPSIFNFKLKSGTIFNIRPIWIGGYAKPLMEGQNSIAEASTT